MDFSINYLNPVGFQNSNHIANFCGYLMNTKPKFVNEFTKENFYIGVEKNGDFVDTKAQIQAKYPQNFNEKQFREIESQLLAKKLQEYDYTSVFNDIFYIIPKDDELKITYDELKKIIIDNLPQILNFEDKRIKIINKDFVYITAHLNQDMPHLHRVFAVKRG